MGVNTGVWIDSKKAVIIHLADTKSKVIELHSLIEARERVEGESNQLGRFGDQYISMEKTKANKQHQQAKDFLKSIRLHLRKSEAVVVFGPAQMKMELEKEMNANPRLKRKLMGVETADSMTENQMVAWVKGYFS